MKQPQIINYIPPGFEETLHICGIIRLCWPPFAARAGEGHGFFYSPSPEWGFQGKWSVLLETEAKNYSILHNSYNDFIPWQRFVKVVALPLIPSRNREGKFLSSPTFAGEDQGGGYHLTKYSKFYRFMWLTISGSPALCQKRKVER